MAEKMEFPLQLKRQYSGSLVADEVFDNQEERMAYLSNPTRYAGQIVVQKDTGKIYVINESKDGYISTGGTASISKEEGNKIEEKDDGIYVSKEIIPITKEEYDALPDDETGKLNPNIIYNVVDETGELINIVDDIVGTNNVWSSRKVNDSLEEINANLGGLTFGQTDDGKWGYKPTGADSVIPFKSGSIYMGSYVYTRQVTTVPLEKGEYILTVMAYSSSGSTYVRNNYIKVTSFEGGTDTVIDSKNGSDYALDVHRITMDTSGSITFKVANVSVVKVG